MGASGWPSPACSPANHASPPAACLLRSNALSLVYLLFLLLLPWFAGPSRQSIQGKGQAVAPACKRGTRGSELFVCVHPAQAPRGREALGSPQKPWAAKNFLCGLPVIGKG